jgi:hypothetical protein
MRAAGDFVMICGTPLKQAVGAAVEALPKPETAAEKARALQEKAVIKSAHDQVGRIVTRCHEIAATGAASYTYLERDIVKMCIIADALTGETMGFEVEADPDGGQIIIKW